VRGAVIAPGISRGSLLLAACVAMAAQAQTVTVELDNPWVHVFRVKLGPHEKSAGRKCAACVIVYLTDAGETAYFDAPHAFDQNTSDLPLEEIVVELKAGAPKSPYPPITLDPAKLDPRYHTVDFENERVRVLRTVLEPDIRSPLHEHPPYVVVYVTELHTTMALADGKLVDNVRRRGEVAWRDAMKHSTENIGTRRAMEIQIEIK
jgi:hypothetical protein